MPVFKIKQGFTHSIQNMKLVSPKEARRMLGVYTAPDGKSKLQYDIFLKKAKQWKANMNKHTVSIYETLMAYKQGILKSLEFPLGPSLLSAEQCYDIHASALQACLSKCGMVSTLLRELVFGPSRYGGLQFSNLYLIR